MRIGTVMGKLALARRTPGFEGAWVQVRVGTQTEAAFDPMGVQPGQMVLIAEGECARHCAQEVLTDAVVAAVLEESGNNG